MNVRRGWSKAGTALSITLIIVLIRSAGLAAPLAHAESPPLVSCESPEHGQFDFWIGDWDAFDIDSVGKVGPSKVARVQVERILDGCVLREQYEGSDGLKGQSFTIYDASRRLWHQSWVTNRGQLLVIEGKIRDGQMVLRGVQNKAGVRTLVRGTWKPVSGGVRETAVTSSDGGKTWKPWFDILFRRHEP